jgi:hypothetical protein
VIRKLVYLLALLVACPAFAGNVTNPLNIPILPIAPGQIVASPNGGQNAAGISGAVTVSAVGSISSPAAGTLRANTVPWATINVQGYATSGDGGGGNYEYVASDTTTADNGGSKIVDAAGHRYYLQGYPFTFAQFGGKQDGVTSSDAILANLVAANAGATVVLPPGKIALTGTQTITLNNTTLQCADVPNYSNNPVVSGGSQGTTFLITSAAQQPFILKDSVAIKGCNFYYPNQTGTTTNPIVYPPLFTDDTSTQVSNILLDNIHVVNAYDFWNQTTSFPTYGNIRIVNSDIYGIHSVLTWGNVAETVSVANVVSNPSLFFFGAVVSPSNLLHWTQANGAWLHVIGNGTHAAASTVSLGGIQTTNLLVDSYNKGVWVDNGALDEAEFSSSTTWDTVPTVLQVDTAGTATRTVFAGKYYSFQTSGGTDNAATFLINNPALGGISSGSDVTIRGQLAGGNGTFLSANGAAINFLTLDNVTIVNYGNSSTSANYYAATISAPNAAVSISSGAAVSAKTGSTHLGYQILSALTTSINGTVIKNAYNPIDFTGNTGGFSISGVTTLDTQSTYALNGINVSGGGGGGGVGANSLDTPTNPAITQTLNAYPPPTDTTACIAGQITWGTVSGTSYLYVCVGTNLWQRATMAGGF